MLYNSWLNEEQGFALGEQSNTRNTRTEQQPEGLTVVHFEQTQADVPTSSSACPNSFLSSSTLRRSFLTSVS